MDIEQYLNGITKDKEHAFFLEMVKRHPDEFAEWCGKKKVRRNKKTKEEQKVLSLWDDLMDLVDSTDEEDMYTEDWKDDLSEPEEEAEELERNLSAALDGPIGEATRLELVGAIEGNEVSGPLLENIDLPALVSSAVGKDPHDLDAFLSVIKDAEDEESYRKVLANQTDPSLYVSYMRDHLMSESDYSELASFYEEQGNDEEALKVKQDAIVACDKVYNIPRELLGEYRETNDAQAIAAMMRTIKGKEGVGYEFDDVWRDVEQVDKPLALELLKNSFRRTNSSWKYFDPLLERDRAYAEQAAEKKEPGLERCYMFLCLGGHDKEQMEYLKKQNLLESWGRSRSWYLHEADNNLIIAILSKTASVDPSWTFQQSRKLIADAVEQSGSKRYAQDTLPILRFFKRMTETDGPLSSLQTWESFKAEMKNAYRRRFTFLPILEDV